MSLIVVGDIGGTNARFGLAQSGADGKINVKAYFQSPCDDFLTFDDAIKAYLSRLDKKPDAISLAAAGSKQNKRIKLTNRNWEISEANMLNLTGISSVLLSNDFAAMARSVPEMGDDDFQYLHEGVACPDAPILVAGAGTGFGVSYLTPTKIGWHVQNTEGGHMAYAPRNDIELEVFSILRKQHGYIPIEMMTSGSGLVSLHKAICERHGKIYSSISPAEIRKRALDGDEICAEICNLRAGAIMGALGDLAFAGGARGGIILAGGVSEKNIEFCMQPKAMDNYFIRGPRSDYLKDIPMKLIKNPMAALIGAAALHMDLMASK